MKKLLLVAAFIPSLVFGKTYSCKLENNESVKMKINDAKTMTAEVFQGKKLITSCLFSSSLPGSDPRGVASEVIQNYENTSCSPITDAPKEKYQIASKIYTKITLDKKKAILFLFSDRQPFSCDSI